MDDLIADISRSAGRSTITARRLVRATPEDLWDAIIGPERAARWLGTLTGDLRQGGRYRLVFDAADPDSRVDGAVLTCAQPHRLVVTWHAPGEEESRVDVTLAPADGGTLLELVHSELQAPASDTGHAAGWQVHLDQLTDGVEHDRWQDQWERYDGLHRAYVARHPDVQRGQLD